MAAGWGAKTEGLEEVEKKLNEAIEKKHQFTIAGLWAGGLIIQRSSMQKVPVEYGNLRGSAYTRRALRGSTQIVIEKREFAPVDPMTDPDVIEVGFGAAYALWVHEAEQHMKGMPRPSGLGVYWGPRGEPQFLEKAVEEEMSNVVRVIVEYGSQPV